VLHYLENFTKLPIPSLCSALTEGLQELAVSVDWLFILFGFLIKQVSSIKYLII